MRGEDKRANRAARLRMLMDKYSYAEMARRLGGSTDPSYFSQIGCEVIQKRGKTPRGLSDKYATRLEQAFNLPHGWFDLPIEAAESGDQKQGATDYHGEHRISDLNAGYVARHTRLCELYDRCSPPQQAAIITMLESFAPGKRRSLDHPDAPARRNASPTDGPPAQQPHKKQAT